MIVSFRGFRASAEIWAWAFRRRDRVLVVGESMLPTLRPGEFVLVAPGRPADPGRVVLAHHPTKDVRILKRVRLRTPDGRVELASDNPTAGADSRSFGAIEETAVLGAVTLILDRPGASLAPPAR